MDQTFYEQLRATKDFVVVLSTTVDTTNTAVQMAFIEYNNLSPKLLGNLPELTGESYILWHQKHLPRLKKYPHLKSVGYWEGREQPNSWMVILPRELALEYVNNAREYLGQDSILAFGPDCGMEIFNQPEDFCTKVGDKWIRFDFSGEVLETPEVAIVEELTEATLPEVPDNYNVEHLIDIAYKVAPNIYYKRNWSNTGMDQDEFVQQAAIYIFDKYNEGYFKGKQAHEITPMVIGMIQGWFIRNMHQTAVNKSKRQTALNQVVSAEDDREAIDLLVDDDAITPDEYVSEADFRVAKKILNQLLKNFSDSPFPSRKHRYIADRIPGFGKNVEASERVLIDLVLRGRTVKEIANYYKSKDAGEYYSHDSKASYISHKVSQAIDKLANMLNALDDDEQAMVKDYIEALMKDLL